MLNDQVKAMLFSFLRVFLASALSAFIGLGQNIFAVTASGWKGILGAAIASTAVVVLNWLNADDPRYGRGHHTPEEVDVPEDIENHLDVVESPTDLVVDYASDSEYGG